MIGELSGRRSLRHEGQLQCGLAGLQTLLREHLRLAQLFRGWVEGHETFEIMAPTPFSLVCFRFNDGRKEEELNAFNKRLLDRINNHGKVFLTHTTLRGRFVLRMAIGQRATQERHVREAWEIIVRSAGDLSKTLPLRFSAHN